MVIEEWHFMLLIRRIKHVLISKKQNLKYNPAVIWIKNSKEIHGV